MTVDVELPDDLAARVTRIVADIEATAGIDLVFRIERSPAVGSYPCLCDESGSGTGINFGDSDDSALDTAELADQIQEAVIEARWMTGRSPVAWPECPEHQTHPLEAAVESGDAVWACPMDSTVRHPIGSLRCGG